jgi:type IV secretion system protein VirB10
MSGMPPRRPTDPEEERDLDASAYEATVPGRLGGFRGTNPIAFVIAGLVAIGIVFIALIAFLHRGAPANQNTVAYHTESPNQAPAAPGLGGPVATPFIPEYAPTPVPATRITPIPFLPIPTQAPRAEVTPLPPEPPAREPVVPAPAQDRTPAADAMTIPQPSFTRGMAAETASTNGTEGQGEGATRYLPVYSNGRLVSMVAVPSSPEPTSSSMTAAPASSQFVSAGGSTGGSIGGSATPSVPEARKFQQDNSSPSNGYVRPVTERQLTAATVINARLMSKIESDLPGPVIAQITQSVYDSKTHSVVVIPSGSRVFGIYDEATTLRSTRVLMAWRQLIFPDGEEFDLGGLPASDSIGAAGLTGDIDKHRGTLYTTAALLTVLGATEAALTPQTTNGISGSGIGTQAQSAAGAQLDQLGNKLLDRAADSATTIIVRPPYAFQIIVTRDLPLDEYATQHQ